MVMGKLVSPPTGLISAKMTIRGGHVYIRSFSRGFREMTIRSGGVLMDMIERGKLWRRRKKILWALM